MDARQLRNLIAVIEKGSLGRAADVLNISQPALTKSIHRLEQRLGVLLFHREAKGMRPTVYCETLYEHARQINAGIDQALREIEALKAGSEGTVRVAAGPLVSDEILSRAVVMLLGERPGIRISIHTAIGDLTGGLMAGLYDFVLAVMPFGPQRSGVVQQMLFSDRISVIARRDHPLASRSPVTARDLHSATWVLPSPGHNHRRRLESLLDAENLPPPRPVVECSSTNFIKSVVASTHHLGLIAHMGLGRKTAGVDREIREIAVDSPFMVRPIGIVRRENQVLSRPGRLLIEAIEAVCRDATRPRGSDGDSEPRNGGKASCDHRLQAGRAATEPPECTS